MTTLKTTTLSKLTQRCNRELAIALEEDFGDREWLWFPGVSREELEAWWSALEDVETFWRGDTRARWPGEFIRMDEDIRFSALWENVWNSGTHRARVALNEQADLARPETYLCRSDGTQILHKGAYAARDSTDSTDGDA